MPTTFGFPTPTQNRSEGLDEDFGKPTVRPSAGNRWSSTPTLTWKSLAQVLTVLAVIFYVSGYWITFHPAYKVTATVAVHSKKLSAVLGENLRTQLGVRGQIIQSGTVGYAKLKIPVQGTRGQGTLFALVHFDGTNWQPSDIALQQGGLTTTILSTHEEPLPPTHSGSGKVYILPLGNPNLGQLERQAQTLSERFHVPVTVMQKEEINATARDVNRQQVVGEALIKNILTSHPELADDYDAFVIGVTDQDMYLKQYNWRFAFGDRQYGRFGVISTARLTSQSDLGSAFFADIRLRKMLTKFLGTLYFQLPLSSDPTSGLSGSIQSTGDLDVMTDNFLGSSSHWSPLPGTANPCVTQFVSTTRPFSWRLDCAHSAPLEYTAESFENDLDFGLFILRHTDFRLGREFPFYMQRMYRPMDDRSRAFGIGTNHSANIFLVGDSAQFTYVDLVLEDGGRVEFKKFPPSPGIEGTYYAQTNADDFGSSVLKWTGKGWDLRRIDGWTYVFPPAGPGSNAEQGALTEIHNDQGQVIRFERDGQGRLNKISHFEGDEIQFTYDSQNRIVHADNNRGRHVDYSYDEQGRLVRVTDSDHHVEDYSYDQSNRMLAIRWDGQDLFTNAYDQYSQVVKQTYGDGSSFSYSYDASHGRVNMAHVRSSDGSSADFFFEPQRGVIQSFPVRDQNLISRQ